MTVKEIKELINGLPDDVEVEINSIYDEKEEWQASPISEMHYCKKNNKIYITPDVISI